MKYLSAITLVLCTLLSSSVIAGPGYLSRDCLVAGSKESITLDWSGTEHLFLTKAMVPKQGENFWTPEFEDFYHQGLGPQELPDSSAETTTEYLSTVKSHAGFLLDYQKYLTYLPGVIGYHYWWNESARRIESRSNLALTCNSQSWGIGNW